MRHSALRCVILRYDASFCVTMRHFALRCVILPVPVAARPRAYVCGRSLAGIAGSNPDRGMDVYLCGICVSYS